MALKPLNSVAGFSVGETPANVIYANADVTANNLIVSAKANLGPIGNVFVSGGSDGQVIKTDGAGNLSFVSISSSVLSNGNSNITVLANANITFSSTGNANIVVISGTGANVTGYLTVDGNIIANGNISANNYIVTPATKDLIIAPATTLTRFYSDVNPYNDNAYNLGNGLTRWANIYSMESNVLGNANVGSLRTNNLLYANGNPWDLQEAAGSNTQVQFNDGLNNFGASANFTFDSATGNLKVTGNANITANLTTGNANLGNLATANFVNISSNLNVTDTANVGNLRTDNLLYANGLPWDLQEAAGSNTQIQFNDGSDNFGASANLTYDDATQQFTVLGNANVTNLSVTTTGTIANLVSANITTASNANLNIEPNGTGVVVIANTAGGATAIAMGDPTQGNLVSNAVTLSNSSSVSNAIAQLNLVLGKLVPPSPPNFPASQSISIQSLSTYRMANYTQTDNTPGANKSVSGGTTVTSVRRASSYTTGNITVAGPGDQGTITSQLNGANAGGRILTAALDGNGTYGNLVIFNNYDYNSANSSIAAGFWSVFSARTAGTVTEGWNEVYIADSAASNSNTANWFYDSSTPGTPTFSSTGITAPVAPSYAYSSTVPHYDNTNAFDVTFSVNKLSGNTYPTSDTFVTGAAGGAFGAPVSKTYAQVGVATPLAQNLYVLSGSQAVATTSTIISGFGVSSTGPQVSVLNSYNTGTNTFSPGVNVLYKTGTTSSATRIEEANVFIGSTIGSGSGLAARIINPGSGNTPVYTGSEANFNSQSSTLQTYDATVVANTLKHDQTNYSTGYSPIGPNLSAGRTGTQYFTFKFVRTSVSKFDVKWTGTIAGLWVALPGSTIDSTSSANGWIDMSIAYAGAGIPGVNSPGNGSDGCALGGVAPLNSAQTNKSVTATFGTVSSSSTVTNEIYIRVALSSGQTVSAISLQTASN